MSAVLSPVQREPVSVIRSHGQGQVLLTCEHASAFIPLDYAGLGLAAADLQRHIAWDPGALELAQALSERLDAPLVAATHSRLLIDLNRDPAAHDSIVEHSEDTPIPGNQGLDEIERKHRRDWLYRPFHAVIDSLIDQRLLAAIPTAVVSIHSFTPVYRSVPRPWVAGVIGHRDLRFSNALLAALRADPSLNIGDNQPYGPHDGVYHTAGQHGEARGLPCAMLEIRQDQLADSSGVARWAERLAAVIQTAWHHLQS